MQLLDKKKIWWLGFSLVLIILSVAAIAVFGLKRGLDFSGGSILEIANPQNEVKLDEATVTKTGDNQFLIKTKPIDQARKNDILQQFGGTEVRFETVGPTVSLDLIKKSIYAVLVASAGIVLYLAYAFRKSSQAVSSWRFGLIAIIALIHDLLITTGSFALMGRFFGYEIDALFITALLTVLGFSVHDTIVVFDRIRENLQLHPHQEFESVANASLIQTLARSLNTSLTVILVLLAMYLLGGQTIKPFIFALLVGITVGTYSSIFVATPLLVIWQQRKPKS